MKTIITHYVFGLIGCKSTHAEGLGSEPQHFVICSCGYWPAKCVQKKYQVPLRPMAKEPPSAEKVAIFFSKIDSREYFLTSFWVTTLLKLIFTKFHHRSIDYNITSISISSYFEARDLNTMMRNFSDHKGFIDLYRYFEYTYFPNSKCNRFEWPERESKTSFFSLAHTLLKKVLNYLQ